jgi:hypothetical protein
MGITMDAFQVASLGHVPDDNGFFVGGELEEVGRKSLRFPSITQRIRCLNSTTVKFRYANHINNMPFIASKVNR